MGQALLGTLAAHVTAGVLFVLLDLFVVATRAAAVGPQAVGGYLVVGLGGALGLGLILAMIATLCLTAARLMPRRLATHAWLGGAAWGSLVGAGAAVLLRPWAVDDERPLWLVLWLACAAAGAGEAVVSRRFRSERGMQLLVSASVVGFALDALVLRHLYPTLHHATFFLSLEAAAIAWYRWRPCRDRAGASVVAICAAAAVASPFVDTATTLSLGERHGVSLPKLTGALRATLDFDQDGFSAVLGGGDCDDGAASVHPGACEVLDNHRDDNCNGLVDPSPPVRVPASMRALRSPLPDIYFVMVDALRHDLAAGADAPSVRSTMAPNLEALARQSLDFSRAYTPYPSTFRAMMATVQSRSWRYVQDGDGWLETLAGHGYDVQLWIRDDRMKRRSGPFLGLDRSRLDPFHVADPSDKSSWTEAMVDDAIAEFDRDGGPRFRWLHWLDPHAPLQRGEGAPIERYRAEVRHVDAQLGRLTAALGAHPRGRDALLIVISDHGDEFGEHGGRYHGGTLFDEVTHVVMVLRLPGEAPRVVERPASLLDLVPTVSHHLGLPSRPTWQGHDWLGEALPPSPRVLSEINAVDNLGGIGLPTRRMVMRDPFKLVVDVTDNTRELYDLSTDPLERRSLLTAQPEVADELTKSLAVWQDLPDCRFPP